MMETDVEMKRGDELSVEIIEAQLKEIDRSVMSREPRFLLRVLCTLPSTRKLLNPEVLQTLILSHLGRSEDSDALLRSLGVFNGSYHQASIRPTSDPVPELATYLHLLVLICLLDRGDVKMALLSSDRLISKLHDDNRRSMDLLAGRAYFYHSRVYEAAGRLSEIRPLLLARLRTSTLRGDAVGQAVLINCLLRNYLHYNLYEQADKLVSKVTYPDAASHNEWARFLYYLAKIKVARLEYSEAQKNVSLALRRAPEKTGLGFRQAANKLAVLIELLLGDIPDKKIFKELSMRKSLEPYYQVTESVRNGDLTRFSDVLREYGNVFRNDRTFNLILRLRRNVLKTAVRGIGQAYARISPAQVALKLGLDSAEEAEYIFAKAIRDGVVEAVMAPPYIIIKDLGDLYKSLEPAKCYNKRIGFCLELHNQSVKSMRYPEKRYEGTRHDSEQLIDDLELIFI